MGDATRERRQEVKERIFKLFRAILQAQPTRRYVLGTTLLGEEMTSFVADRQSLDETGTCDVISMPECLLGIVVGMSFMKDEDLGCGIEKPLPLRDAMGNSRLLEVNGVSTRLKASLTGVTFGVQRCCKYVVHTSIRPGESRFSCYRIVSRMHVKDCTYFNKSLLRGRKTRICGSRSKSESAIGKQIVRTVEINRCATRDRLWDKSTEGIFHRHRLYVTFPL